MEPSWSSIPSKGAAAVVRPLRRLAPVLALAAATALLVLSARSGGSRGSEAPPPRRLVVALSAEPVRLDPHDARDGPSAIVNFHLYDRLVELAPDLEVEPALARSWEVSEDGRVWTFHLESGVFFHDGEPLTAEAVAWNLHRLIDPDNALARRDLIAPYIEEVRSLGELTLEIRLKRPVGPFLKLLAHDALGIVSPKAFQATEASLRRPAGTGPFRLREWVPGDHLLLEAFDAHWRGRPYFDEVLIVPVPEGSSRAIMVETGAAHLAFPIEPVHLARLASLRGVEVVDAPGQRVMYAALNLHNPPFDSPAVRRAVNYAVDVEGIAERLLFGHATPVRAPLAPSVWGYAPAGDLTYAPERARRLLVEAGVAPSTTLELWGPSGRYPQDRAVVQAIAHFLEAAGFKVRIRLFEWATYLSALASSHEWHLALLGWVPSTGDADMALRPLFHSQARGNHGRYRREEIDRLLDDAVHEPREERRRDIYRRIQGLIAQDVPALFLYSLDLTYARRSELQGVRSLPTELIDFRFARFEERCPGSK